MPGDDSVCAAHDSRCKTVLDDYVKWWHWRPATATLFPSRHTRRLANDTPGSHAWTSGFPRLTICGLITPHPLWFNLGRGPRVAHCQTGR